MVVGSICQQRAVLASPPVSFKRDATDAQAQRASGRSDGIAMLRGGIERRVRSGAHSEAGADQSAGGHEWIFVPGLVNFV